MSAEGAENVSLIQKLSMEPDDDDPLDDDAPRRSTTTSYATFASTTAKKTKVPDGNHINNHHHHENEASRSLAERILSNYVGARLVLVAAAAIYGTNFPLGALMDEHLPASAATAGRMIVAALALSYFWKDLMPQLFHWAVLSGVCSGLAYVTQSLALVHTNPARVSFLGSATVVVVPVLEAAVDRRPMGLKDAPQTWLAACLCFVGVGVLELNHSVESEENTKQQGPSHYLAISTGDILALIQAIGFGVSCFINNKILRQEPHQFLPVTATLIATTAVLSILWSLADGWMWKDEHWFQYTLPGLLLTRSLWPVAGAMLWTGLISTSMNYSIELSALGRMPPSEASVILASEPLWAALFAAALYGTGLSLTDTIGGLLIVAACVVNATLTPGHFFPAHEMHDHGV